MLKESGYNAIRTSHNPMSTALLDACDKYGMLVMDELFDCWRAKKNPGDYHLYFEHCWKEDTASVILRDRNHPSVIMYSIGNEIGERDGSGHGAQISHDLATYVRTLDNTRAITNGVCMIFLDAGEFGGILANIFGSGEEIDFKALPKEITELLAKGDYLKCKRIQECAQDVEIYEIKMVDAQGNRVAWFQGKIKADIPQGTKLMGLGTENPVSEEDYFSDTCSLYEGRALLVIRRDTFSTEVPVVHLAEE